MENFTVKTKDGNNIKFLKYFTKIFKNSSFLIIDGLIVALYLTVSSVFANKMNFHELTYFNAMLIINGIAQIISFGIVNGLSIFINQNYKDKDKVSNYIKSGLLLSFIIAIIFSLILILFKSFIIDEFLNINVNGNYTFYYLMVAVTFLTCITFYLRNIFKCLKKFVAQIIISISYGATLITGFLILWLSKGLLLNYVGILYIIVLLIYLLSIFIIFLNDKDLKLNIFSFKKYTLTFKEFKVVMFSMFSELVWLLGSVLIMLAVLKVSEHYFNAYSYYENVLDLFNTFYFAFVVVNSIELTRKLGDNEFEEAYLIGEYSIYATIIIWLLYVFISLVFFKPIISGLNVELKSIGFISLVLYITIFLPRFIVWNISTYILPCGGKVRLLFYIEAFALIYSLILYSCAHLISQNIYLVYFLLSLDNLIKMPIMLILFKRKKWLVNVNNQTDEI